MFGASWLNLHGLFDDRFRIAVIAGVGLDRQATVLPLVLLKGRQKQFAAALADMSSTTFQPIWSSLAVGMASIRAWIRGFQLASSCLMTDTAITGLQVAPTAPCSIE